MDTTTAIAAKPTSGPRIDGIDLARAIAVSGMIYIHLGPGPQASTVNFVLWHLSVGSASALFAVLAGVSISLMGSSAVKIGGPAVAQTRHRLIIRSLILIALGLVLDEIQVAIAVVLTALGTAMILLSAAFRAKTAILVATAIIVIVLGPALQVLLPEWFANNALLGGSYPIFAWVSYGLVGILAHRLLFRSPLIQVIVLVAGVFGKFLGVWSQWRPDFLPEQALVFFSPEPHSGSLIEQLSNICAALAVLMAALLLCRPRWMVTLFYPLRAVGAMGLTVYVAHVVIAAVVLNALTLDGKFGDAELAAYEATQGEDHTWTMVLSILLSITAAALWKLRWRRGPLEELMARAVARATRTDLPARGGPIPPFSPGTVIRDLPAGGPEDGTVIPYFPEPTLKA